MGDSAPRACVAVGAGMADHPSAAPVRPAPSGSGAHPAPAATAAQYARDQEIVSAVLEGAAVREVVEERSVVAAPLPHTLAQLRHLLREAPRNDSARRNLGVVMSEIESSRKRVAQAARRLRRRRHGLRRRLPDPAAPDGGESSDARRKGPRWGDDSGAGAVAGGAETAGGGARGGALFRADFGRRSAKSRPKCEDPVSSGVSGRGDGTTGAERTGVWLGPARTDAELRARRCVARWSPTVWNKALGPLPRVAKPSSSSSLSSSPAHGTPSPFVPGRRGTPTWQRDPWGAAQCPWGCRGQPPPPR